MRPSPRWRKILRDLGQHKARSILTIISIAVGVLAIGFTGMAQNVLDKGIATAYQGSNPSQVTFVTSPLRSDQITDIRSLPGVAQAQGRATLNLLINTHTVNGHPNPDQWQDLLITAVPTFSESAIDKIVPVAGQTPKQAGELALDESTVQFLKVHIGQQVWVQSPSGSELSYRITGIVHDTAKISSPFSGESYGYTLLNRLPDLGVPQAYNTLSIQVNGDKLSEAHIENVAQTVRGELRREGVQVASTLIPQPGKHWAYDILHSITSVLEIIGVLDAVLGACLVYNTVLASLTSQVRQIGVMKTLGASARQLIWMYAGYVCLLSIMAFIVGVPLAMVATAAVTSHSVSLLGIATHGFGFSPSIIAEMLFVGLLIPLASAMYPIVSAARTSVREAISGQDGWSMHTTLLDKALERLKGLPRVLVLGIRNTFRRKGRLLLTMLTLGIGGAVVMGTLTVQQSLNETIDQSLAYTQYDLRVTLNHPAKSQVVADIARSVAGVKEMEAWGQATANMVRTNGTEGSDLTLLSPPPNSSYIHPQIVAGRWLQPNDTYAIVIDTYLLHSEPNIHVGQTIQLDVNGQTHAFQVVGMLKKVAGDVDMYVPQKAMNEMTGTSNTTNVLNVRMDASAGIDVQHIAAKLRTSFTNHGFPVSSVLTTQELQKTDVSRFSVVLAFLKVMSGLISVVAGLGLMGSQTINVLERTREVGILRSIGASTPAIWTIVIEEGLFVGALGWIIASILSIPVSHLLSDIIGRSLFSATLNYSYATWSVPTWLLISLVISALCSLLPARNATKLTIRDVLAHE